MSYLQESLLQDEKITYASRPHWIVFMPAVAVMLLALLMLVFLPKLVISDPSLLFGLPFSQLAALVVVVAGIFSLVRAYIFYATTEYGITNKVSLRRSCVT